MRTFLYIVGFILMSVIIAILVYFVGSYLVAFINWELNMPLEIGEKGNIGLRCWLIASLIIGCIISNEILKL